jgi:uncharacterized protein (DUF433 family)
MRPLPDIFEVDTDGEIRFKGHRLRLIDVAARYDEGHSPEGIVIDYYPTLSLAQVYLAIGFYLENEAEIKALITENARAMAELRNTPSTGPSMAEMRRRLELKRRAEAS